MTSAVGRLLLAVCACVVALPVLADPPARVGRLSLISGSVSLTPAGLEDEWSDAYVNRPITIGDRLWTSDRSRAEIRIGAAGVRLDERTSADVLDLDDRYVQLRLGEGRLALHIGSMVRGGTYEIDTPGAAVLIRAPGTYRIDVRPDADVTTLIVREGEAELSGSQSSVQVRRGEVVEFVDGGQSYGYYSLGRDDDFDRFYLARIARDDRRVPRYVSVDMTGYEDLDEYGTWSNVSQYGNVWFPSRVDAAWAPYRDGRWIWLEPWGWTWVDNEPWGFAPFHYGRWVRVRDRWGWAPGDVQARPVYAPALVAWVGGSGFSVSASSGATPVVGWFPLAYREPYIPWYETSPAYARAVNVQAHVTNISVTQFRYAYRNDPVAVTAVPSTVVVQAQPVARALVALPPQRLAQAPVVAGAAPVAPTRQSVVVHAAAAKPPPAVVARRVVAVQAPPAAPPTFAERERAVRQHGAQPFRVQALAPAQPGAARAGSNSRGAAGAAPSAPAERAGAPNAPGKAASTPSAPNAATATATVASVQVIKPAAARERAAGAPPPAHAGAAPAPPPPPTAGAPIGAGAPTASARPGAQPPSAAKSEQEAPKAAAEAAKSPRDTANAAAAPPKGAAEGPKAALEPPKGAPEASKAAAESPRAEAPKVAPEPPKGPAEGKGPGRQPSSERTPPGTAAPAERTTPPAPVMPPREAAPTPRAAPASPAERATRPGAERSTQDANGRASPPGRENAPPRAVAPTMPVERSAPPPEPAAPKPPMPAVAGPVERSATPVPQRAPARTPERNAPAAAERAAPAAAPAPERSAPPAAVERAAPPAPPTPRGPPVERAPTPAPQAAPAPRAAPSPQPARAAPPSPNGAPATPPRGDSTEHAKGKGPEKGKGADDKRETPGG